MQELYCIIQHGTGLMKFGLSKDPARRLAYLQTGSGYELTLIFSVPLPKHLCRAAERSLHQALEALPVVRRMQGEWFAVEPPQWAACVQTYAYWKLDSRDAEDENPESYQDFLLLVGEAP